MEASGDDPGGGYLAWVWVLVIFAATTAGLRCLLAVFSSESLSVLPSGQLENIEELLKEGLAEALEQEDTAVMRAMYVAIAACIALQLGGANLGAAHEWRLRCCCLVFLAWRAASVATSVLLSVLDSLAFDEGREGEASTKRRITRRLERRKSMVAGKLAEHRAHQMVCNAVTVTVHAMAVLFVFENMGIEVRGFISYMGFLGLALSLAAQYMLQDLLGYSALMVDASIVVGDVVIVGSDPKGSVEAVGYLSTKVRTLDGELLIYRNREFATARVVNCSRQPHRLVTVPFELAATTAAADLRVARECAQQAVEELVGSTSKVAPDLGGFVRWADFGARFHNVWMSSLAEGDFRGVHFDLYFYLDGTASKSLEFEAKTLVYMRLAEMLEERGIRTQGALLAESLAAAGGPTAAAARAAAGAS